ncbi:MAG: NAD(P)/FAD-dependent oxidoreductase [Cellvibrionales bacterium]|nr:NAD(P)/FAD-dependent oxidoreductase [Cellvibrionales bacterium]
MQRIVIVGGGAGGAELATLLGNHLGKKKKAEIILVDANRTHFWKPRLHEVAAGVMDAEADELDYMVHSKKHHFTFKLGRFTGLDRENKKIVLAPLMDQGEEILPERELSYDNLVISVGSQTNDFGTKGAAEHCIFLDKRNAAEAFHRQFLNVYLKASQKENTQFNIAIVGAGATGVELAAELNHAAHQLVHYGFDGIKPENVSITIIEAANRVMPALSEKASKAIRRQLENLHIQVLTQEMVTEVTDEALYTASGKVIEASLKVWSAGVKAPDFLNGIGGLSCTRSNQIIVSPELQSQDDPSIFAFGDCASCVLEGQERPLPPRAQVASQQASYLAKSFKARLANKPISAFVYKDKGSLVSLSKQGTVGNLMGNLSKDFTFEGKLARFIYISLYRLHQKTLHGYFTTSLLILKDLISRKTGAKIKVH